MVSQDMDPDPFVRLPLRDAMLQWCDQALAQLAVTADAKFQAAPPEPRGPSWLHGDSLGVVRARRQSASPRHNLRNEAELAWQALIDDFRALVAAGAVVLSGLQTKPSLAIERSDLPPAWAPQMRFNPTKGRVTVADVVFANIMVRRPSSIPMPHLAEHARPAEASAAGADADTPDDPRSDDASPLKARGKPGRKPKADVVREHLLSRWEVVTTEAALAPSGRPNFSKLARAIHRQLMRQTSKADATKIPHEATIRKNLPQIYDNLLEEARCGK